MIFLADFQISQNLAVKIFETYGAEIYDVMKENPYRLAEDITGVGFGTADKIAAVAGIAKDSPFRIRSGIVYALQQTVADGHTYLPADLLVERAAGLLETRTETVEQQMEGLVFDRKLIRRNDRVYLSSYYYAELNCARMLHDRNLVLEKMSPKEEEGLMKWLQDTAKSKNMETDSLQLEAVKGCVRNGLFLLSGGPGTGKTTTINLIIEYFVSRGLDLLLAAPTGRAAKRMSEATGYEASTIHRLLEIGGSMEEDRNHAVFQKNEENPLEADVVIIDEMSMVDLMLFQALLRAITPGTRLIMVGDVDQLPSVGAGQVLRDLLASGAFPQVILQKIFRQAKTSDIVVNAHKINEGEEIRLDTHSKDFLFMERDREQVIKEIMVWMMRDKLPDYCHADRMDIQVLTPMRKGALGCQELNQFLQQQLNPPAFEKREHLHGDIIFREGDKVMQIKNNYKLEWEITGLYGITVDSGLGVFNGDMGRVKQVDETAASLTVEFDDGRCVVYPWSGLDELELAYATTIHKAQGSEYPAVILPLLDCPKLLQYRNLLYTGITRAKSCVVLLGSSRLVRNMIENTGENRRYSSLQECIAELK